MNQANQRNLLHNTNMILVSIRNAEIHYFTDFYTNFGTQGAIIVGIIAGTLSQTPAYNTIEGEFGNPNCPYPWVWIYFVSSAATVVFGMQVLLCSVFLVVYGQGLALRGPIGSMVTAVEGMIYEQQQTLLSFVLAMISYVLSEVGMFFIVMDQSVAIASTIFVLLGGLYTYNCALRIYNRFKFKSNIEWDESSNPEKNLGELDRRSDDHIRSYTLEDESTVKTKTSKSNKTNDDKKLSNSSSHSQSSGNAKSLRRSSAVSTIHESSTEHEGNDYEMSQTDSNSMTNTPKGGYMTLKASSNTMFNDPWQRRYFILRGSHMFYYKDQRAFELNAAEPINRRPIELEGYALVAGAMEPPYTINLIPSDTGDIRKSWNFRCDTSHEFEEWINIFSKALKAISESENRPDRSGSKSPKSFSVSDAPLKNTSTHSHNSANANASASSNDNRDLVVISGQLSSSNDGTNPLHTDS